jgi:ABC-type glycerol-3-phosphate transport system substrate-binding protein
VLRQTVLRTLSTAPLLFFGLAACGRPPPERGQSHLTIFAPPAAGRLARVDLWNQRYGKDVAIRLEPVSPAAHAGDSVSQFHYAEAVQAAGIRDGILWLAHEFVARLALVRGLQPIGSLVKGDRFDLKPFMPCALQPGYGLDRQLYALPEQVDAGQLYFNREHLQDSSIDFRRAGLDFERPANTWERFRRASLDLAAAQAGRARLSFHAGHEGLPLELWGWLNGGTWVADGGRRVTFDREDNVQALGWLVAHAREIGSPPRLSETMPFPPVAAGGDGSDYPDRHPLLAGRVSLCFESARFVSTLAGARADFPLGYVEVPRRRAGEPLMTWSRSAGYALLPESRDTAWQALKFLVGEEAIRADARVQAATAPQAPPDSLGPPVRPLPGSRLWFPPFSGQLAVDKSLARLYRTGVKLVDEAHDHGMEQLRHARFRDPTPAPHLVWPLLQEARRQSLERGDPREALQAAQQKAQSALNEAWSLYDKKAGAR